MVDPTIPATLADGRFRVLRELGRGSMGQVLLVEDAEDGGRLACLKTLHAHLLEDAELQARFTREFVLARRIAHRGVSRVDSLHEAQGSRYLKMEFVDGVSLKELLRDPTPLPVARALAITRNLCTGLAAAHDCGVVHRDLKPSNIMLRAGGVDDVCLLDFGVAAAVDGALEALTRAGIVMGTRAYIAPEVWDGDDATPRSDVFAVGVVLYRMLTGRMPWPAADRRGPVLPRFDEPPPPPSSLRPDVPAAVDELVAAALARAPARRTATARALADACDLALDVVAPIPALTLDGLEPDTDPGAAWPPAALAPGRKEQPSSLARDARPPAALQDGTRRQPSPSATAADVGALSAATVVAAEDELDAGSGADADVRPDR